MYTPLMIQHLQGMTSNKDKSTFITQNKDSGQFVELLTYALHPFFTYKLSTVEYDIAKTSSIKIDKHQEFIQLCQTLNNQTRTQQTPILVARFLESCDTVSAAVYADIITKKPIGVSASTTNKALKLKLIPTFECQLSEAFDETRCDFKEGVIVERKEDGVRCLAVPTLSGYQLYSRTGQRIYFPALETYLNKVGQQILFDGELLGVNRKSISGKVNASIKKEIPLTPDICSYSVWDALDASEWDSQNCKRDNYTRATALDALFLRWVPNPIFTRTPSQIVHSLAKLQEVNTAYIVGGFEGSIVKPKTALYDFKRSYSWMKLKVIQSTTLEVVGYNMGKNTNENMVGSVVCQTSDRLLTVSVNPLTQKMREEFTDMMHNGQGIGLFVEVIFNTLINNTADGTYSLFLPRFKGEDYLRVDKTEADSLSKIMKEHVGAF